LGLIDCFWDQVPEDFFNIKAADHSFPVEAIQTVFIPFQPDALMTLGIRELKIITDLGFLHLFLHSPSLGQSP
jgi:hypothetical protein